MKKTLILLIILLLIPNTLALYWNGSYTNTTVPDWQAGTLSNNVTDGLWNTSASYSVFNASSIYLNFTYTKPDNSIKAALHDNTAIDTISSYNILPTSCWTHNSTDIILLLDMWNKATYCYNPTQIQIETFGVREYTEIPMLFYLGHINETINHTEPATHTSTDTITMTINNYFENITSLTATLTYNNNNYPMTTSYTGPNLTLTRTINTPDISESPITYNITYTINGETFTTENQQQTLTQQFLNITFSSQTTGIIIDPILGIRTFNDTNITIDVLNLTQDQLGIYFNGQEGNYTQAYEFTNTNVQINENLNLLNSPTQELNVLVKDTNGLIIPSALVVLHEFTNASDTFQTGLKIGQQYTDNDGYATFQIDGDSHLWLSISKSGYTTTTAGISQALFNFNSAYEIRLTPTTLEFTDEYSVDLPNPILTKNNIIYGYLYTTQYSSISFQTDYMTTTETLTESEDYYHFELTPNTHFNQTSNDNITINFYQSGTFLNNYTIVYLPLTDDIFSTSDVTDTTTNLYSLLLLIALILTSFIIGTISPGANTGFNAFMIGLIILSFLTTTYLWVAFISMIHYILRGIYKVTGE